MAYWSVVASRAPLLRAVGGDRVRGRATNRNHPRQRDRAPRGNCPAASLHRADHGSGGSIGGADRDRTAAGLHQTALGACPTQEPAGCRSSQASASGGGGNSPVVGVGNHRSGDVPSRRTLAISGRRMTSKDRLSSGVHVGRKSAIIILLPKKRLVGWTGLLPSEPEIAGLGWIIFWQTGAENLVG